MNQSLMIKNLSLSTFHIL